MYFLKQKKILAVCLLLFVAFIVGTTFVYAQDTVVQLKGAEIPIVGSGTDLSGLIKGWYQLGIAVGVLAALVVSVWAGFEYMTTDVIYDKTKARGRLVSALQGLLLIALSYLILQQINPGLVNFDILQTIQNAKDKAAGNVRAGNVGAGSQDHVNPPPTLTAAEQTARQQFTDKGITVQGNQCPANVPYTRVNGGCTDIANLKEPATLNGLSSLRAACVAAQGTSCNILVTAGAELGHQSHGPGLAVVDIAPSTGLNTYLTGSGGTPPNGTRKTPSSGGTFTFETAGGASTGNHWHVSFP